MVTDRHGYVLREADTVLRVMDNSRFVISRIIPDEGVLVNEEGNTIYSQFVMLCDDIKRTGRERASFCELCDQYYLKGVAWLVKPLKANDGTLKYSACRACMQALLQK
jgi:hypothetical protein